MIQRYLDLHVYVIAALTKLKSKDLLKQVEMSDVEILERMKNMLLPFKEVTTIISTESSSSVSLIRPLLHKLLQCCKPDTDLDDPAVVHEARATLYHDLELRYKDDDDDLLNICTFLDPRVKTLPYLEKPAIMRVHERVSHLMFGLCGTSHEEPCSSHSSSSVVGNSESVLDSLLGDLYSHSAGDAGDGANTAALQDSIDNELQQYKRQPLSPMSHCPISW